MTEKKRGGLRSPAGGRPRKEPTVVLSFRVPEKYKDIIKQHIDNLLKNKTIFIRTMTVDRQHTEIFDQAHKMWAEGTSIGNGEGLEPKEQDIQHLLGGEGWVADEIDIWFDDLQKFWRWSCKISHP